MDTTELSQNIAAAVVEDTATRVGDKESDLYEWRKIISIHLNANVRLLPQGRVVRVNNSKFRPLGSDSCLMRARVEHCADLTAKEIVADCYKETGHEYSEDDQTHWAAIILDGMSKYL